VNYVPGPRTPASRLISLGTKLLGCCCFFFVAFELFAGLGAAAGADSTADSLASPLLP
jgi:hypothetical protein